MEGIYGHALAVNILLGEAFLPMFLGKQNSGSLHTHMEIDLLVSQSLCF